MDQHPITFHGFETMAVRADGQWWVSPRQMCEHLGLTWSAQRRKIRTSGLAEKARLLRVQTAGGLQKMLMLPLGHFGVWLLSIHGGKVAADKRPFLTMIQQGLLHGLDGGNHG